MGRTSRNDWLLSRRRRRPAARQPSVGHFIRRLRIEPLEDRRLLSITVNTLIDEADGSIIDGDISLRDAIAVASAGETINFSVAGGIILDLGQLLIDKNLTISGPGADLLAIIAVNPTAAVGDGSRIFNIGDENSSANKTVTISGLELTGGDVTGDGGAIRNLESLTIASSVISGNSATSQGGGIYNRRSLAIVNSTISNNTAADGGGVYGYGGSITVSGSTVSGNQAPSSNGGGINIDLGTLNVHNSTISGNASENGGGIFSYYGTVTIENSTISGNQATTAGGGIHTFSVELSHSIVAGNLRGAVRDDIFGTAAASFTLIGDNTGAEVVNNGGNLIGTSASPINPLLGPLADNGGPTRTHTLLTGSPAIDAGDLMFAPPPSQDQRGAPFVRVFDGDGTGGARIDIGAYERQTVSLVVDVLVDENDGNYGPGDRSLREAIIAANGSVGNPMITFAASLTSGGPATIVLTQGELAIRHSLTVNGPGANLLTIDASRNDPTPAMNNGDGSRVLKVDDGTVSMINVEIVGLTLTGGDVANIGGGILSDEHLIVKASTISGNSAAEGGGVFGYSLTIDSSTISGNVASSVGGGISIGTYLGNLTVLNSTVSGNRAGDTAGGIRGYGTVMVRNTTITQNQAGEGGGDDGYGGGIVLGRANESETATIHNTIVADNFQTLWPFITEENNIVAVEFPILLPSITGTNNLIGTGQADGFTNGVQGNQVGVANPLLGALADNGGPTKTHALLNGSPAIDAGDPAAVAGIGTVPQFDQRGSPHTRVSRDRIDIGAFELQVAGPALPGDYNQNGTVDAADYTVWRDTRGSTVTPFSGADGDGDGTVDGDDYDVWKTNFGNMLPMAASAAGRVGAVTSVQESVVADQPMAPRERDESISAAAPGALHAGNLTNVTLAVTRRWNDIPTIHQSLSKPSPLSSAPNLGTRQDDALIAWLLLRSADDVSDRIADVSDDVSDTTPHDFQSAAGRPLDLAFAALAANTP